MALFNGLGRAYGIYEVPKAATKGAKREGKARTVHGEVTTELWQRHLAGEIQLGIVPIRDDNCCVFAAIDVDDYAVDHDALNEKIKKHKLPLTLVRSKSGGAHLDGFFSNPVAAEGARELMIGWAATLGYAKIEIFPKQSKLLSTDDAGNWINMPYCGGDDSDRHAIVDGKRLTLEEFLTRVEGMKIPTSALEAEESPELLVESPPCLVTLANSGISSGGRNNALFSFAVYARKRFGDDWEDRLVEMNERYFSPPLDSGEVRDIIKHVKAKDYFYRCKEQPIVSVCQKSICLKRKYGITGMESQELNDSIDLKHVQRVNTDPPVYFADYEGKRVRLEIDDLISQTDFIRAIIAQVGQFPPRLKASAFNAMMTKALAGAEVVEVPEETVSAFEIVQCFEYFAKSTHPGKAPEDVVDGYAFQKNDRIYFMPAKFQSVLTREFHKQITLSDVWSALTKLGATKDTWTFDSKQVGVWSVADTFGTMPERKLEI